MKKLLFICLIKLLNSGLLKEGEGLRDCVLFVNVALFDIYLESIKIRLECFSWPFGKQFVYINSCSLFNKTVNLFFLVRDHIACIPVFTYCHFFQYNF